MTRAASEHWRRQRLSRGAVDKVSFDVEARIAADQAASRATRERWLEIEREKYGLPVRGRLIDDMPV